MSDFEREAMLQAMFATLRNESTAEVRPAGMDAVRATVRHRRRVRVAALSALAVVLTAAPVAAAYAASYDPHRQSNPAASSTPGQSPSTRAETPSPSSAPDARTVDLRNATIDVPAWQGGKTITDRCPAGAHTFVNGRADAVPGTANGASYELPAAGTQPVYADLDGQPGDEILVSLGCYGDGSSAPQQLLALKVRDDGTLATLGSVLATTDGTLLAYAPDVRVLADGTVLVQVFGPWQSNGGYPPAQQRGYRYQDGQFRQVEGPTGAPTSSSPTPASPPAAPVSADLAVTASDVVMSKPDPNQGGLTTGKLTITVTNRSAVTVQGAVLEFAAPTYDLAPDQGCANLTSTNPQDAVAVWSCDVGPLNPGQTRTLVFAYTWWGAVTPVSYPWYVKVTPDAPATDPVPGNNKVSYTWSQAS
jgi:hypothetical protein